MVVQCCITLWRSKSNLTHPSHLHSLDSSCVIFAPSWDDTLGFLCTSRATTPPNHAQLFGHFAVRESGSLWQGPSHETWWMDPNLWSFTQLRGSDRDWQGLQAFSSTHFLSLTFIAGLDFEANLTSVLKKYANLRLSGGSSCLQNFNYIVYIVLSFIFIKYNDISVQFLGRVYKKHRNMLWFAIISLRAKFWCFITLITERLKGQVLYQRRPCCSRVIRTKVSMDNVSSQNLDRFDNNTQKDTYCLFCCSVACDSSFTHTERTRGPSKSARFVLTTLI